MIVCRPREIAARLYEAIIERRPEWHSDDIATGVIKVVYSGDASDSELIRKHVRRQVAERHDQAAAQGRRRRAAVGDRPRT